MWMNFPALYTTMLCFVNALVTGHKTCTVVIMYCVLIQLTPLWGLSVTDYIKYYAYLSYYCDYFLNCVYPNPHCQLSLWEETGAPGETHNSFHTSGVTHSSQG
jgi:hypothetical protein